MGGNVLFYSLILVRRFPMFSVPMGLRTLHLVEQGHDVTVLEKQKAARAAFAAAGAI